MSEIRETWGRYAPAFVAEGKGAEDRDSIRRLVELCDVSKGALVLDVATGAGYTAFAFARTGCRVIPSDPTHEMLLATRSGWKERELPGDAVCVETWAETLPFGDRTLDAVVAHRAPHQFSDQAAFAGEARRVLKARGVVGISDQSPPDGWETWHNDFERMRDPTHEHARSPREWRDIFTTAGLEVRATDVVYHHHDVQDWLDRVGCPPDRSAEALRMLEEIPDEIRDVYRPEVVEGRLRMRTPQCVVVASI